MWFNTNWSSTFHPVLLTHALPLSASQLGHKKKPHEKIYEYEHGGIRSHEIDLYQVRG